MITLERDALAGALALTARVVEKRNTIPILSHILIASNGAEATLTATDLDITARATVKADGAATRMALPAEILRAFVARLPEGAEVSIAEADDGARATLKSGRTRAAVNILPATDFPEPEENGYSHTFDLAGAELAEMFTAVAFAMADPKEPRGYLRGVYLHGATVHGAGKLVAAASDGQKLAEKSLDAPDGAEGIPGIIVPDKVVRMAEKLIADTAKVTLSISETKIRIAFGGATIISKLVDGTYPDYRRLIGGIEAPHVARVPRAAFAEAAERVAVVTGLRSRGVACGFADNVLTLKVNDPDTGECEDAIDITYDGDHHVIGMQARYIAAALAAISTDEVSIAFENAGSPVKLTPAGDDSHLVVIMPIRI